MSHDSKITRSELRAALALSVIFFLRMVGLFMLLPVLALYADRLTGATPLLIGLALGIYGLTQTLLQIPMGSWSDRIGRKPVIAIGLLVFAAGGAIAALSSHVAGVIIGRAVQGAGAVSGATMALAADLTRANQRTKVMAIIGISIGGAFSVAFIAGPALDAWAGLGGVFWTSVVMGLVALPVLFLIVPDVPAGARATARGPGIVHLIRSPHLGGLYGGVFCLHLLLAASFVSIPVLLSSVLGIPSPQHYAIYLPVIVLSIVCVMPLLMLSSRTDLVPHLSCFAIVCLAIGELMLGFGAAGRPAAMAALVVFFAGFNFLEASLPSRVSTAVDPQNRGAALGTYSTAQFLGMFIGGVSGGAVASVAGPQGVFASAAGLAAVWFLWALRADFFPRAASGAPD